MKQTNKVFVFYGILVLLFIVLAALLPVTVTEEVDYMSESIIEMFCSLDSCETDTDCVTEACGNGRCVEGTCRQEEGYIPAKPSPKYHYCYDTYLITLALLSLPLFIIGLVYAMRLFPPYRGAIKILLILYIIFVLILAFSLWVGASETRKPVIYLYPEETTEVLVRVVPDIAFTNTIPEIVDNEWQVIADPSGELRFGKETYPYLFYESLTRQRFDLSKGWVVEGEKVVSWFDEYLPKMGLNDKETKDFLDYWGVHLPPSEYYRITLLDPEEYDKAAHLTIAPAPDTVIRVILAIDAIDKLIDLEAPVLNPPEREGFVAVEWGAILL